MNDRRKSLVESQNFWLEEAKDNRWQAMASRAIAATGIFIAFAGASAAAEGNLAGAFVAGGGTWLALKFEEIAQEESGIAAEATVAATERQHELDQLDL